MLDVQYVGKEHLQNIPNMRTRLFFLETGGGSGKITAGEPLEQHSTGIRTTMKHHPDKRVDRDTKRSLESIISGARRTP